MWITKPEFSFKPSLSKVSGTLHTRKDLIKAVNHASKTPGERSCWAMTHIVGLFVGLAPANRHRSSQVRTKGSMRDSLYIQSHARTTSILGSLESFSLARSAGRDPTASVSQSNARNLGFGALREAGEDEVFFLLGRCSFGPLISIILFSRFSRRIFDT